VERGKEVVKSGPNTRFHDCLRIREEVGRGRMVLLKKSKEKNWGKILYKRKKVYY